MNVRCTNLGVITTEHTSVVTLLHTSEPRAFIDWATIQILHNPLHDRGRRGVFRCNVAPAQHALDGYYFLVANKMNGAT